MCLKLRIPRRANQLFHIFHQQVVHILELSCLRFGIFKSISIVTSSPWGAAASNRASDFSEECPQMTVKEMAIFRLMRGLEKSNPDPEPAINAIKPVQ